MALPAAVALALYVLLSYIIVPLWQRYRGRYSRYIPLDTIGSHTSSLRHGLQDVLTRFLVPSSWRSNFQSRRFGLNTTGGSDSGFDEEDGEELFEVDDSRREALSLDASRGHDEDAGIRLSRDLEEGFRDDSDEDDEAARHGR